MDLKGIMQNEISQRKTRLYDTTSMYNIKNITNRECNKKERYRESRRELRGTNYYV